MIVTGVAPTGQPSSETKSAPAGRSNLALRIVSSLVLAPLAIFAAWYGSWPFTVFWGVAAVVILGEWIVLVLGRDPLKALPWTPRQLLWVAGGIVYAGGMLAATLQLRFDVSYGFAAIVFLFAVVWMTDIAAYFAGRAFGGPKLMPRVSPSKTWSGAVGGTLAGIAGGVAVAKMFGIGSLAAVAGVALALSIVSQAGDLLESAVKRRFSVKDSGSLLPGHGGLMDRLDGYVTAVVVAAAIGIVRGGIDAPARGLLVW